MKKRVLITAGEKPPIRYLEALAAAGAEGTVSAPRAPVTDYAPFCALLLAGGGDLDPARYGQENRACRGIDSKRDALELEAVRAFLAAGKPILGICRGFQVLNVALGGTLIQHLPTADLHMQEGADLQHTVRTSGFLETLYGARALVNSSHHQAVDRLGAGLLPAAVSADGVIEAAAHTRLPVLGVQFHPERMENGAPVMQFFCGLF